MDCVDDNQPNFKHYCRVCKRGFMCGRALGGHMRAHGIGDENNAMNLDDDETNNNDDDDDQTCDWDEKTDNGNKKKMYKLRTNPNRLKSCKNCEHCGEEFVSWKSFLEHGKCGYDEDGSESLVSAAPAESEDEEDNTTGGGRTGWSKRKRSLRSEVLAGGNNNCVGSGENDDFLLAACLVQLANTVVDLPSEPEESCASASRELEEMRNNNATFFASSAATHKRNADKGKGIVVSRTGNNKGLFECKACKKVFNSHQALGGHRASHKKVKGCYAARQDQLEDNNNNLTVREDDVALNNDSLYLPSKENTSSHQFDPGSTLSGPGVRRKSKVHECSICHRVFSSGQALGGHKRCHWITSNSLDTASPLQKLNFHHQSSSNHVEPKVDSDAERQLDLNVPVWATMSGLRRDPVNPLSFDVPTDVNLEPRLDGGNNVEDKGGSNRESQQTQPKNEASEKVNVVEKGETNGGDKVVEDEADSSVKFDKMADLKDMETNGDSSKWLQVGICSTAAADS